MSIEDHQRAGLTSRSYRRRVYEVASYRYSYEVPKLSTKLRTVVASAWSATWGKRILFFPEMPPPRAILFMALLYAGHRVILDPEEPHDATIKWWDATFAPNSELPAAFLANRRIINLGCEDISKSRVDRICGDVFGHTITVDPTRHHGICVEKSDENGAHDGKVIDCPIDAPRTGFVYQKLVNNVVADSTVEDIRVPVFAGEIPFVYRRTRPVDIRFSPTSHTSRLVETHEAFSADELAKILEFTRRMQLECGDLDIVRDQDDQRLYIVDANTTPWSGSLRPLAPHERIVSLRRTARAFEAMLSRVSHGP